MSATDASANTRTFTTRPNGVMVTIREDVLLELPRATWVRGRSGTMKALSRSMPGPGDLLLVYDHKGDSLLRQIIGRPENQYDEVTKSVGTFANVREPSLKALRAKLPNDGWAIEDQPGTQHDAATGPAQQAQRRRRTLTPQHSDTNTREDTLDKAQLQRKMDRIKHNIVGLVYDPNLSNDDLEYLERFFNSAIEMEAGLENAEQNLRAVRIHIEARKLVQELKEQSKEESS